MHAKHTYTRSNMHIIHTQDAASRGLQMEGMSNPQMMAEVLRAEKAIKERVGIGECVCVCQCVCVCVCTYIHIHIYIDGRGATC